MSCARQRGQRLEKSDVKTRWARHWIPKMWPQSSFTGRLTVSPNFHTLLSKGDWQMTQKRWSGGMCLILMLEAVRRKSNCAVIFFNSDTVVEEMGIVMYASSQVQEGRKGLVEPSNPVPGLIYFKILENVRLLNDAFQNVL